MKQAKIGVYLKRKVLSDIDNICEEPSKQNVSNDILQESPPKSTNGTPSSVVPIRIDLDSLPWDPIDRPRIFNYVPNQREVIRHLYYQRAFGPMGGGFTLLDKLSNRAFQKSESLLKENQSIADAFNKKSEIEKARYIIRLNATISCVRLCLKTENPMRGYDEYETSLFKGMFLDVCHFLRDHNEAIRAVTLENAPKNCTLTSLRIQKDVACFAKEIVKSICLEIGADVFSLLVDESSDVSEGTNGYCCEICYKYGLVKERFVGIVQVKDTSSSTECKSQSGVSKASSIVYGVGLDLSLRIKPRSKMESIGSKTHNCGSFLPYGTFYRDHNEAIRAVTLENAPKNCTLTSLRIQKDVVACFAKEIVKSICLEIGADVFSLLVDESSDVSKKEQMAIVLRYVDKYGTFKRWIMCKAKVVRLRSHLNKFLVADDDEKTVRQSRKGSSVRARWTVEMVEGKNNVIRLKSCSSGKYLTPSSEPFLTGMTGKKVVQDIQANKRDSSMEWEPIKENGLVKLKSKDGKFLRANGGTPPWRNSVTYDLPQRSATKDWTSRGGAGTILDKVKEFGSLDNLKMVLCNEGFSDVDIRYLGGMWGDVVFKCWRIMWVDVEGVPLKMWSFNTFKKIGAKWGTLLDVENKEDENYHSKRLCIHTKGITNVFESFKIVYKGKVYWVRAKEVSGWIPDFELTDEDGSESDESQSDDGLQEGVNDNDGEDIEQNEAVDKNSTDPFGFYSLLRKNKQKDNHESSCKESLKFPPGFTPREEGECDDSVFETNGYGEVNSSVRRKKTKLSGTESVGSGHFQQSEIPRSGGSLLNVMDELIRVGQTMGYKMEGCIKNVEEIVERQGVDEVDFLSLQETKMEDINLFDIKKCWGNFVFDYVFSESNGFSGGILCIWNPTVFNKYSTTVSDYFIIVRGKWISNGKLLLIISVYAPQEALEKKMLWDYLNHIIISWKGEVILMGDFNEVRYKNERYGSVFNVQGAKVFNSFIANSNLVEVPLGGCSYTWCHGSASKMSKLDRFLMSERLLRESPSISATTLDRKLKRRFWGTVVLNKAPGPDGFTFGFYKRYWGLIESDVVAAVKYFFQTGTFYKGCNSSFISLIPKIPDAKLVKDFRPISLIGSLYKIITKILANRIMLVLGNLVNEVQSAFMADRQILDGRLGKALIRSWDYLHDVLRKFGFGDRWRGWIYECLRTSRGSVLVNGSPTEEFQFFKGLKQGDPLAPFLFILVMESLHISFNRVVEAGLFQVGGSMSRVNAWDDIVDKLVVRLSKWKMKTLSIGGRLTLLKSVLGAMSIYHMSIFKVPMKVLHRMESIRSRFFNGVELNSKKAIWVKWCKVLASKAKGGLGVSSLFALHGDMAVWYWVLKVFHKSIWCAIVREEHAIKCKDLTLVREEELEQFQMGELTRCLMLLFLGIWMIDGAGTLDGVGMFSNKKHWRSKDDDVTKISKSVFVTNFPDHVSAKELWHVCKQYGHVVDSFIPVRRSKVGKRFGFVRFINVFDIDRLVGNLCTVWIGSHHLHANVARFNRPCGGFHTKANLDKQGRCGDYSGQDESCVNEKDYSLCLNGKVKEFGSLDNLKMVLCNEGFSDVDIRYLGGMWGDVVFKCWRIMWVDVEGVPLKMWSFNTFKKIGAKWGTLLDVENKEDENYHSKRLCIHTKGITNVFESFKIVYKGKVYWVRAKEVSGWIPDFELTDEDGSESDESQSDDGLQEGVNDNDGEDIEQNEAVDKNSTDPFGFYSLLRKNKQKDNHESSCKESLKFPPGFTPREEGECDDSVFETNGYGEVNSSVRRKKTKLSGTESVGSGHFQQSEIPRSGGSLLNVMDELIRVGQTMGYKMEGCIKNVEEIVERQGVDEVDFLSLQETKMEDINLFDIKKCWGNFVFDYVFSESNGFSGGILCIWNPTVFNKYSTTVSDYFIIVRGKWISNGKLLLIISVYAPQEALEKKMLWDYLNHIIISWKGEVILMGDFNEVRYKNERYGSVFNVQGAKVFNSFIANSNLVEVPLGGCSYTWCHGSASKMSKLDRFLMSERLLRESPSISAITLDSHGGKPASSMEDDENSKFYHGILNKKRHQLAIRGVMKDGVWEEKPDVVKKEFVNHFKARFEKPSHERPIINMEFPNQYWGLIESDVVAAVKYFFQTGTFYKGCNSSFISLIPKIPDAKLVKDFRPISLIGSLYKIITKILANRIMLVLGSLVNEVQSAFMADRQILDGRLGKALIRSWDYLHDVLRKFGFGDRWCGWIYECLRTSRGSVLVNGSPTEEFQFFKGLKQGDPLAPFLFILVMESLHISFNRVVEAGLFQVGGSMSRVNAWDDIVDKLVVRLSKWKMKTLSIGGRLTLLKSVLGAMSIYHMSIFKVPMKVLHRMESIRSRFFNGVELNSKKAIWVKWCKVLASKDKGGLGVSSLFALHGDMAVWYWVLKVFHKSIWCAIVREEHAIKCKDLTLVREEELEQFQMGELTRCLMLLFLGIWMIDGAGTLDGVGFFGCFGSKSFG
ncbi:RNA-directed DNA polymerase, eukaryota [Tanacetum coccineum]